MQSSESTISRSDKRKLFLVSHKSSWGTECGALFLLFVVLLAIRYQAVTHLSTLFIGGAEGDGGLYVFLVRSNLQDFFTNPFANGWFSTPMFYPFGKTLAWSDNYILPSFVVYLLSKSGLSFIVSYNLSLLLANLCNGYFTHRVVLRLSGNVFASVGAGAAFMGFSFLAFHLGHPQLQWAFFLPMAFSAWLTSVDAPSIKSGAAIGIITFLAFLSSVYYALFIVVLIAACQLSFFALRPNRLTLHEIFLTCFGGVLGVLPVVPFCLPYQAVKSAFGERGIYEAYYFSARAISYICTPVTSLLYGHVPLRMHDEANLFPGLTILLIATAAMTKLFDIKKLKASAWWWVSAFLLGIFFSLRILPMALYPQLVVSAVCFWAALIFYLRHCYRLGALERSLGFTIFTDRSILALVFFVAFFFFFLSCGPLGNPEKKEAALGLFSALYYVVPGFDGLRAIGRAGIPAILFLIIAAFLYLSKRITPSVGQYLFPILLVLISIENMTVSLPLGSETLPPKVAERLTQAGKSSDALIFLPLAASLDRHKMVEKWSEYAIMNTRYMNWGVHIKRPFVNGYSGIKTKFMREFPKELRGFPDERSLKTLRRLAGLKHVIYVSKQDPLFSVDAFLSKIKESTQDVTLIGQDQDGNYLLEVHAAMELDETSFILVPSSPPGSALLSIASEVETTLTVALTDRTQFSKVVPIIVGNQYIKIDLPPAPDPVRPRRVTLGVDKSAKVILTSSGYSAIR